MLITFVSIKKTANVSKNSINFERNASVNRRKLEVGYYPFVSIMKKLVQKMEHICFFWVTQLGCLNVNLVI